MCLIALKVLDPHYLRELLWFYIQLTKFDLEI